MALSIYEYLNQLSSENLFFLLQHYAQPAYLENYRYAVDMIIEILKCRDFSIPSEIFDRITEFQSSLSQDSPPAE